eukprot:371617-Pleurochrysis_carterae.AAC.4
MPYECSHFRLSASVECSRDTFLRPRRRQNNVSEYTRGDSSAGKGHQNQNNAATGKGLYDSELQALIAAHTLPSADFLKLDGPGGDNSFGSFSREANPGVSGASSESSLLTVTSFSEDKWQDRQEMTRAGRRLNSFARGSCRFDSGGSRAPRIASSLPQFEQRSAFRQRGRASTVSLFSTPPDSKQCINEHEWSHAQQRRTLSRLVRIYPRGLRTRSDNFDPLPCWASGAQLCALNLQTNDLATQLHYALFELNGGLGYVPKPAEMMEPQPCWPPPKVVLKVVTVEPKTLFQLPARNEERPCFAWLRGKELGLDSGQIVPELSFNTGHAKRARGKRTVPIPTLAVELHAIGGFHCVSTTLPPESGSARHVFKPKRCDRGDAHFNGELHCLAAEPMACVLRIAVIDEEVGQEVAYDTVMLGAVREGYRVIHLRSMLGTRIESCFLLVKISFQFQYNAWVGPDDLLKKVNEQAKTIEEYRKQIAWLQGGAVRSGAECGCGGDGFGCSGGKNGGRRQDQSEDRIPGGPPETEGFQHGVPWEAPTVRRAKSAAATVGSLSS